MKKFIAKEDIGGFKKGDEVPESKAIVWSKMFIVSPVEEIKDVKKVELKKEVEIEEIKSEIKSEKKSKNNKKVKLF